ncbi:MAG: flagellar hook basal-body protein [Alphaproteobacteria bacterium]|nr:flagellar hook basal-body protein [Alphaproteobacteria bacterium]
METPILIGLSRQMLMKRQLSVIANNIANASTVGFKSENMMFSEHLAEAGKNEKISFVRGSGIIRDRSMGELVDTANSLDLAISGRGYFSVENRFGVRYKRNGHFRMDELRQIVNSDGHPVLSENEQPIELRPNDREVTISKNGDVSTESGKIGKIQVFNFQNENLLRRMSNGLYLSPLPPEVSESPVVLQGKLEQSNVETITEVTKMIELVRAYESASRLIEGEHDRERRAIQTLTKMN